MSQDNGTLGQSPMDSAQGESWVHTLGEKPRDNEGREIVVTLGPAKQHLAGPATPQKLGAPGADSPLGPQKEPALSSCV